MGQDALCEGRVCIVTGAGRGIGRQHALTLAGAGACVLVNDVGSHTDGSGASTSPADDVVAEIRAGGGEAEANGDDVSSWEGAQRIVNHAIESFGDLHVVVNNAGILRDRMLVDMTEDEWDAVIRVHLKGTFELPPVAERLLARPSQGGQHERCPDHQHHVRFGAVRHAGTGQLRGRQSGHRRLDHHRRHGARRATASP